MSAQAYPLAWPPGWPRTSSRSKGAYRTGMAGALKNLRAELRLLCGDKAVATLVLSSNVSLGVDNPADPGVVAYFTWEGEAFAIPNDRWLLPEHNVQAIALTIEAMRAMERHGSKHMIKASFRGFTALPAATAGQMDWRKVLGITPNGNPSREQLEGRRRYLALKAHPDVPGGSTEAMAAINEAFDQAVKELGL